MFQMGSIIKSNRTLELIYSWSFYCGFYLVLLWRRAWMLMQQLKASSNFWFNCNLWFDLFIFMEVSRYLFLLKTDVHTFNIRKGNAKMSSLKYIQTISTLYPLFNQSGQLEQMSLQVEWLSRNGGKKARTTVKQSQLKPRTVNLAYLRQTFSHRNLNESWGATLGNQRLFVPTSLQKLA